MPKRIVIIGAGYAGINCAQTLAKALTPKDDTEVVLLEKSAFYYHVIGTPRAYTDASFMPKLFVPFDNALAKSSVMFAKIIRAIVTKIDVSGRNEVTFRTIDASDCEASASETLTFNYLVIATGSTYTVPIKPDSVYFGRAVTEAKLQEVHDAIAKASKILVVGGGAVGCEVAGHIASKYPTKHVTILEGRDKLISTNDLKDKFYRKLTQALAKLKINVILGERLTERLTGNVLEKRTLTTDKGTVIEADIQLLCGGFTPVTQLVADMDTSLVTDRGFIKVTDCFQLEGAECDNVFALGDASNHATPKLGYWAGEQGKHLAHELVRVLRNKQPKVVKPFPKVTVEALLLPLGPCGGVSQLPVLGGSVVGDTTTSMIKGKDMFAGKMWSDLGATLPK